jgi:hypothetical protein
MQTVQATKFFDRVRTIESILEDIPYNRELIEFITPLQISIGEYNCPIFLTNFIRYYDDFLKSGRLEEGSIYYIVKNILMYHQTIYSQTYLHTRQELIEMQEFCYRMIDLLDKMDFTEVHAAFNEIYITTPNFVKDSLAVSLKIIAKYTCEANSKYIFMY